MIKKRLIAFLTGTVLLIGSAVPSFAENENTQPGIIVIAEDEETVLLGVEESSGEAEGGLLPADIALLLTGDPDKEMSAGPVSQETEGQEGPFAEEMPGTVGAADLPSAWRPEKLPAVETQGIYNTCWAFAAMKSSEVNLLKNGFGEGTDFSELQMIYGTWFGEGDSWTPPLDKNSRPMVWYNAVGNYLMATSSLARHYGAADGALYPYNTRFAFSESDRTADIAAIDRVIWPGTWPKERENWKSESWEAKNQTIRELIYEYGALSVSFNEKGDYSEELNAYYTEWPSEPVITEDGEETEPAKPAADHAVTFIGWDDAKETQEGMGAFLAINSWGEDWGENGLFWISYNDASLSDPAAYVMEAREPGVMRDDTVYSYTGAGYSQTAKSTAAVCGANVFTAEKETILDRVGFYLPANASYTARVLSDLADPSDPSSGTERAVVTGETVYGGFYKADLPENVMIGAGETFTVELTVRADNRNCVLFEGLDRKGAVTVCHEGESFYYNGTSWADSAAGVVIGGRTYNTLGNIPIYAYGIGAGMAAVPCDADTDGMTGLADLLTALRAAKGLTGLTNYGRYAADLDRSGHIDGADAALIAGELLKEIE